MLFIAIILLPQDRLENVGKPNNNNDNNNNNKLFIIMLFMIILLPQDRLENVGNQFAFTTILSFLISVPVMLIKVGIPSNLLLLLIAILSIGMMIGMTGTEMK